MTPALTRGSEKPQPIFPAQTVQHRQKLRVPGGDRKRTRRIPVHNVSQARPVVPRTAKNLPSKRRLSDLTIGRRTGASKPTLVRPGTRTQDDGNERNGGSEDLRQKLTRLATEARDIHEIRPFMSYATADIKDRELPEKAAAVSTEQYAPLARPQTTLHWAPSNLHHYPLYFEDPSLERYGHTYHPLVQPFASAGRFTTQLIGLPYQMTIDPVNRRRYTLGWYRPGDCAPKKHYQIPLNKKAALVEAGFLTGVVWIFP